jgi:hypothetical protein
LVWNILRDEKIDHQPQTHQNRKERGGKPTGVFWRGQAAQGQLHLQLLPETGIRLSWSWLPEALVLRR